MFTFYRQSKINKAYENACTDSQPFLTTPLALFNTGFVYRGKIQGLFKAFITMYQEMNGLKLENKSFEISEK